jgi:hypothetical protein
MSFCSAIGRPPAAALSGYLADCLFMISFWAHLEA